MLHLFRDKKKTYFIWVIVVAGTIFSFVIGFNFLFGTGAGNGRQAADDLGSVDGQKITREDFATAYQNEVQQYAQRSGRQPDDATAAYLRDETWNTLVGDMALGREAARMGLGATDREVVFAVKNMPPQEIMQAPGFQTNGQFDISKYRRALSDPNMNWAPVEDYTRRTLPTQKLQMLGASMTKVTDAEVQNAYARSEDKVGIELVGFPNTANAVDPRNLAKADLEDYFHKHESEFDRDAESNIAVLIVDKRASLADQRAAEDQAQGLYKEAVKDTNFAAFANQISDETVNTAPDGKGGRIVEAGQLVKNLESVVFALKPGEISPPVFSEAAYHIVKYVEPVPGGKKPQRRILDLVVQVKPGGETLDNLRTALQQIHDAALKTNLADEAKKRNLNVHITGWFTEDTPPSALVQLPDLVSFAFSVKKGTLSQLIDKPSAMLLVQVMDRRPAGKRSLEEADAELRTRVAQEKSLDQSEAKAKKFLAGMTQSGASLEDAARHAGLTTGSPVPFTRSGPFMGEMANEPRLVGSSFGFAVGSTHVVRGESGAYVLKVVSRIPFDMGKLQVQMQNLKMDLYRKKQQEIMQTWMQQIKRDAKIQDLRAQTGI